ncbi:hypothetical protein KAR91_40685 [Candidatus Pacearchaeota archaeon]|nr:hypothetical protein [Candidatus Pacearchaeota archaeon]
MAIKDGFVGTNKEYAKNFDKIFNKNDKEFKNGGIVHDSLDSTIGHPDSLGEPLTKGVIEAIKRSVAKTGDDSKIDYLIELKTVCTLYFGDGVGNDTCEGCPFENVGGFERDGTWCVLEAEHKACWNIEWIKGVVDQELKKGE